MDQLNHRALRTLRSLVFPATIISMLLVFLVLVPAAAMADTWGDQINDPTRFVVLPGYGGTAVLDQETGLDWEQSPAADLRTWQDAQIYCGERLLSNRFGWRLPTVQELSSLVDSTTPDRLPPGHPFNRPAAAFSFWTATTWGADTAFAWIVQLINPGIGPNHKVNNTNSAWCVRGGQGVNPQ